MYVPMTGEMLDVLEWGECEWPPMMRRLMWQEAAHWKARHAALVEAAREVVESGAPANPIYNRCKYCGELLHFGHAPDCAWARMTALVEGEDDNG